MFSQIAKSDCIEHLHTDVLHDSCKTIDRINIHSEFEKKKCHHDPCQQINKDHEDDNDDDDVAMFINK